MPLGRTPWIERRATIPTTEYSASRYARETVSMSALWPALLSSSPNDVPLFVLYRRPAIEGKPGINAFIAVILHHHIIIVTNGLLLHSFFQCQVPSVRSAMPLVTRLLRNTLRCRESVLGLLSSRFLSPSGGPLLSRLLPHPPLFSMRPESLLCRYPSIYFNIA